MTVLDLDVVLSDYALCFLSLILSKKLASRNQKLEALFFFFSALASFVGGTYHGFFPEKTGTILGKTVWVVTLFSVALTANCIVFYLIRRFRTEREEKIKGVVYLVTSIFLLHAVFRDHRFVWAILYYVIPILSLGLLLIVENIKSPSSRARTGILGVGTLLGASILQQLKVGIHPKYFDHNALYHLISFGSLICLYLFFKEPDPTKSY